MTIGNRNALEVVNYILKKGREQSRRFYADADD